MAAAKRKEVVPLRSASDISPKVLVPALTSIALAVVVAVVTGDWTIVAAILTAGAAQAGTGYQTPDPQVVVPD